MAFRLWISSYCACFDWSNSFDHSSSYLPYEDEMMVKKDMTKFFKLYLILLIGVIALDFFWHKFFTQDNFVFISYMSYVLIKAVVVLFFTAFIFFALRKIKLVHLILLPMGFSAVLSIYYRFFELFGDLPFGVLAGRLVFGSTIITAESRILFPLIWFTAHSLVFGIPLLIYKFGFHK